MLVISSKEFRDKQKCYLDKVDEGMEILIQRGKNKSYKIVPVTEDDILTNKEYVLEPDEDLARAIPFEKFREIAINHIRDLYKQNKK
jgi:hypothetical protein